MNDAQTTWQKIAVEIGNSVYRAVNLPELVGTKDETGYVLMFFNTKNHQGKSTLVSSAKTGDELRTLLETALKEIGRAKHIDTMV